MILEGLNVNNRGDNPRKANDEEMRRDDDAEKNTGDSILRRAGLAPGSDIL
ncbi:MAG: hypothetical protein MZV63_25295 [Marinilabiliales bacterium]|nr:hypothetical protein [Marinilabiliales bacterium]